MAMTNAEKQRAYRARKAAEREAAKAPKGNGGAAPKTMRDAVDEALAHMKWLVASDAASKAQARELAREIDELTHEGDRTRALSAHRALSRVLSDLGGTPQVRLQRELRSLKHVPSEADGERKPSEGEAAGAGGVVTKFERPARRSS